MTTGASRARSRLVAQRATALQSLCPARQETARVRWPVPLYTPVAPRPVAQAQREYLGAPDAPRAPAATRRALALRRAAPRPRAGALGVRRLSFRESPLPEPSLQESPAAAALAPSSATLLRAA